MLTRKNGKNGKKMILLVAVLIVTVLALAVVLITNYPGFATKGDYVGTFVTVNNQEDEPDMYVAVAATGSKEYAFCVYSKVNDGYTIGTATDDEEMDGLLLKTEKGKDFGRLSYYERVPYLTIDGYSHRLSQTDKEPTFGKNEYADKAFETFLKGE